MLPFFVSLLFIVKLSKENCRIIISSRPPLPKINLNKIDILGLDSKSAKLLLQGFEKDEINRIVEFFDGPPLGITMVKEDMSLESTQKGISSFLENEILAPLSEKNLSSIYELAIQPEPIEIDYLFYKDQITNLDNLSLIKYYDNKIALHNFVKNLLITQMEEEKKQEYHIKFVDNISKFTDKKISFLKLFHKIQSKKETNNEWIRKNADTICNEFPARSSALFHNLISKDKKNGEYYWYASISECEMGNWKIAENLIRNANTFGALEKRKNDALIQKLRIARLSGDIEKAEELFEKIYFENEYERIKFIISEISRKIDDRIPGNSPNENSIILLNKLNLNSLNHQQKRDCLIAIAIIKHTYSLYQKDFENAEKIRSEIYDLTSKNSEIL